MEAVESRGRFQEVIHTQPLVVMYARAGEDTPALSSALHDLQVLVGSSVAFITMDMRLNEGTRDLKRALAIARFPSVIVVTHGESREIMVGEDCRALLATVARWHQTVYESPVV